MFDSKTFRAVLQRFLRASIVLLVAGVLLSGLNHLKSFQECEGRRQDPDKKHAIGKSYGLVVSSFLFYGPSAVVCAAEVADENHDLIVTMSTVAIAFFTYTLWSATRAVVDEAGRQRADLQRSIKAAEDSVKAANEQSALSEKALIASNRPYLVFKPALFGDLAYNHVINQSEPPFIKYQMFNYGNVPAIIRRSGFGSYLGEEMKNPPSPSLRDNYIIVQPKSRFWDASFYLEESTEVFDRNTWVQINLGKQKVWIFGTYVYEGLLAGYEHETSFCWYYHSETGSFREYGGEEYNRRT